MLAVGRNNKSFSQASSVDTNKSSEQQGELSRSIEELDALLHSAPDQQGGTRLDTSHLKQTADKMHVQAQELRQLNAELKKKLEAAREDNKNSERFWLKLKLLIYIGLLVFAIAHLLLYGR